MQTGLKDKHALVLGSSRGLGFAIAEALSAEGARLSTVSRSQPSAAEAATRMTGVANGFGCDTASATAIDRLFQDAVAASGPIDVLVLNSGGPRPGGAQQVPSEEWRAWFDAMFVNLVRLADLALPAMIERKFGRIISVVSSGVIQPIPNLAISNAIRPALIGWGKTLATEVAAHGVTVNAIAPGRIATDRIRELDEANAKRTNSTVAEVHERAKASIPARRLGEPHEFAAAAVFLASEAAAFVTGSVLRVDGGQIASV